MSKAQAVSLKLLEVSRKNGYNHQMLLIRFFHERLLYRLSLSEYRDKLMLKGGNLIYSLHGAEARPTLDIDFAGRNISNEIEDIKSIFKIILSIDADDEVNFDCENLTVFEIIEHNEYVGLRLKVLATLGNIKQNIQVDIGYGDVITPAPLLISFPVILEEFQIPQVLAYTPETVIAEKIHAMIVLAQLNSRMKDFYDVYTLITNHPIEKNILKTAIEQTFQNRKTPLELNSIIFTEAFYGDSNRVKMWAAFLKKIKVDTIPFEEVIHSIKTLMTEVF